MIPEAIEDDNIKKNFYDPTVAMFTEKCRHHWHNLVTAILSCLLQEDVAATISM